MIIKSAYEINAGRIMKEKRDPISQIFSNLATNTAAGISVSGDAAEVFDPDLLSDAQKARESLSADTQEAFKGMQDDYAQSSAVALEALKAERESLDASEAKESADIVKKKSEFYQEQAKSPDPTVLSDPMKVLKKEIEVLEAAAVSRQSRFFGA